MRRGPTTRPRFRTACGAALLLAASLGIAGSSRGADAPARATGAPATLSADPVERARKIYARIDTETKEADASPDSLADAITSKAERESLLTEFDTARVGLRDYLASNKGSSDDVLLLMKLHLMRLSLDVMSYIWARQPGVLFDTEPYATILDQAIAADPKNGDLHYWRGYFYSVSEMPEQGMPKVNPKRADAIREMRAAVELKPSEDSYRRSLAYLLVGEAQYEEATRLYKGVMGGKHPAAQLMEDWSHVPAVPGTTPGFQEAAFMPELFSDMLGFGGERSRNYVYRGSVKDFEAQCKKIWPGFKLVVADSMSVLKGNDVTWVQQLEWKGTDLVPVPTENKFPAIGDGGYWVEVSEREAAGDDPPYLHPGVAIGAKYLAVRLFNARPLPAGFQ